MEEKGVADRILALAYGNHPKSASLKPEALKVLRALREQGTMSIEQLMGVLGLDPNSSAGRKHFYILMRPLRETGMISTRRVGGKTSYYLSYDGFSQYLREIRKEAEYWLTSEVLKERT
jgi:DNA-binding transcriptional ArsR family regulator